MSLPAGRADATVLVGSHVRLRVTGRRVSILAGLLAAALVAGFGALVAPRALAEEPASWIRPVWCGATLCGSMEVSWYRSFADGDATPEFERQGVNIRGRFRGVREQAREFHYLQVLTRFEADDYRWSRDASARLPTRFVDPPPFGMRQPAVDGTGRFRPAVREFDALPWFDDREFPVFDDRPRAFLASARRHGIVVMEFETWLVCVIDARPGPDPERVGDDRYEVGALIGWVWGYEIRHHDRGEPGVDELEDYAFTRLPLRVVSQPSEAFVEGLGTTLGGRETDRFDIRLGDTARCPRLP